MTAVRSNFQSMPQQRKSCRNSRVPPEDSYISSRHKLSIVRPPELGADVDTVIETFTRPLQRDLLDFQADDSSLLSLCLPNTRGVSDCHATVVFKDSPLTTDRKGRGKRPTWNYSIIADPARNNRQVDFEKHRSDEEDLHLPLQLAVNNAIANSTVIPDTVFFSPDPGGDASQNAAMSSGAATMARTFLFIFAIAHFTIIYRLTSFITSERDAGLSQLIDSMGGGSTITTRVLSWLVVFDLAALPCYLGLGILYQRMFFRASGVATLIGWQILNGLAVNSSTVFAAAFFSKARTSAVYVIIIFIAMSIAAQWYSFDAKPPASSVVLFLTLFFPSVNSFFFSQQMCLWEISGQPADPAKFPPEVPDIPSKSYGVSQGTMLWFLVLNIFIYPVAAICVEKLLHGIHFRKRKFSARTVGSEGIIAQTLELSKSFFPSLAARVFCRGKRRRKPVKAVDGVEFDMHLGQITCLVGPNGSGKTTTLHMMAGFISPTQGSIRLGLKPSQIGICPQRNTLWDELTDAIKAGNRSRQELDQLIDECDLKPKRKFKARELSGGQKRKLQLACMFVGDSSICLIDECTSGLDPLSRRAIWEILLNQCSRRSIVFTTHFLDEVDILADQIVLLCRGKIKCQGASAQLKTLYGGGYKVLAPLSAGVIQSSYPPVAHRDKLIYQVPDSHTAAKMVSNFIASGTTDVAISGPQFEDVFLNLLSEEDLLSYAEDATKDESSSQLTSGKVTSFWVQFGVLYRKRWAVLKISWIPYVSAVFIPVALGMLVSTFLIDFKIPKCDALADTPFPLEASSLSWNESCPRESFCQQLSVAPSSANGSLFKLVQDGFQEMAQVNAKSFRDFVQVHDSRSDMLKFISQNTTKAGHGGSGSLLDLWSQISGSVEINTSQELSPKSRLVFYPTFFVLYPAMEKSRKNLMVSVGVTLITAGLLDFKGPIMLALPVLILHGLAATMMGYIVAHFTNGPLRSFVATLGLGMVSYTISLVAILTSESAAANRPGDVNMSGITYGANLFLPIGNVIRALVVSLNLMDQGCKNGKAVAGGSLDGLGGPLLYLALQTVSLLLLLIWLEAGMPRPYLTKARTGSRQDADVELSALRSPSVLSRDGVREEVARAERSESDPLRVLHINKAFGTNKAVDDLTFGLARGEVMALIGPNGAGKSTLVNMMQGELVPDQGRILLCQTDSRSPSAKTNLGVCPQYDAPDFMSTRDHLVFYARIKGIKKPESDVNILMDQLNLTPHAKTPASKLSGGNKRKLMLAIALIGKPPIIVLDEPTSAMDAVAKRRFWRIIQNIAAERSVLLTTHSMEEADALATRTAILARRFLAIGTSQELRERFSNVYYANIVLTSAGLVPRASFERQILGGQASALVDLVETLERDMGVMGIGCYSISGPTLENVFLSVVRENNVQEEEEEEEEELIREK
ncbi:hypothetical protein CP533_6382 [Ophiocordyceps camponoti-saundersi (nom. inval.)]|nr:hypothetical protein CP533_6382 [Ophiocordyceps camponoti-saundersi (nom. inval.)]